MGRGGRGVAGIRTPASMPTGARACARARPGASSASGGVIALSVVERTQLGTVRRRLDGAPSAHPYPEDERQWQRIRATLLARSLAANALLDPAMTAYTPGETESLLAHPDVVAWHARCVEPLPDRYSRIVLVPCAKTKPWTVEATRRSKLYAAYHAIIPEVPDTCFVTVSEPLGIVPMGSWGHFPQYDNPGLFSDDAQQSGMTRRQWEASEHGRWYGLPFDPAAQRRCIETLGGVVGAFLAAHADREIVSFVDGVGSTHGRMLDVAVSATGTDVTRHAKRGRPRVSPEGWIRDHLGLPTRTG